MKFMKELLKPAEYESMCPKCNKITIHTFWQDFQGTENRLYCKVCGSKKNIKTIQERIFDKVKRMIFN